MGTSVLKESIKKSSNVRLLSIFQWMASKEKDKLYQ